MKKSITALLIVTLLSSVVAIAQENVKPPRTINVNGTAKMEVVPDEIYVQVDLREYDKKNGTKVDIEQIRTQFLKAAVAIGIPDTNISVQGYQGWDGNYWWYKRNKKKNPDMKASITYQVKLTNVKKMDELVQKLDDEATQNFFISRTSHSRLEEFKRQLKIQAVRDAKAKAIYLAEAIGESAGEAITINEPGEVNVYPRPMYDRMVMAEAASNQSAAPAPDVDFKKIRLEFNVHAVFALK